LPSRKRSPFLLRSEGRPMRFMLAAIVFLIAGRALADGPPAAGDVEFFEKKIRPILFDRCYRCHSNQSKKQKGGLHLDSRAALLKGGDSGPALVPGDLDKSLLIRAVRYQTEHLQMPPSGRLPAAEVAALEAWVRRGAVFPGAEASAGKTALRNLA